MGTWKYWTKIISWSTMKKFSNSWKNVGAAEWLSKTWGEHYTKKTFCRLLSSHTNLADISITNNFSKSNAKGLRILSLLVSWLQFILLYSYFTHWPTLAHRKERYTLVSYGISHSHENWAEWRYPRAHGRDLTRGLPPDYELAVFHNLTVLKFSITMDIPK